LRPNATGRIEFFRQVVTQLQFRVFQEARELLPLRKRVVRRLTQRTRRQGSVASCLDFPADDLHQGLCSLQAQHVTRGVIELLRTRQGVDPEQLIDPFYYACRYGVVGIELDCIEELPSRMRLILSAG
jgi:hypothetical protein